jgi:hypothetical protein
MNPLAFGYALTSSPRPNNGLTVEGTPKNGEFPERPPFTEEISGL